MELLVHIIVLCALVIGSYTDIKTREVPDLVNYGLIFLGFGLGLIFSIVNDSWWILLKHLFGFAVMFLFGALMFYSGQWGGGDSKMLMGIGSVVGIGFSFSLVDLPLLFKYIFAVLVVGGLYGIFWGVVMGFKYKQKFVPLLFEKLKEMKRVKIVILVIGIVLFGSGFMLDIMLRYLIWLLVLLLFVSFYLIVVIKAIEEVAMIKSVPVSSLTEGDWINETIRHGHKVIVSPKDLGISKEQIKELKKLKIKTVQIKEGMPFVPAFLIAYIVVLMFTYLVPHTGL